MSGELTRRALIARGAALVAGTAAVPLFGDLPGITAAEAATTTTQQTNATRAVAAYNAMQQYFYVNDGTSLYIESYPLTGSNKYSFLWPFTRALVGTLALAGVPTSLAGSTSYISAVQDRFTGLGQYWDGAANPPAYDSYVVSQGGGDKYHDDNAWVSLAFIEQYRMGLPVASGEPAPLNRAEQLFTFAKAGWDANPGDRDAGGIFWVQQGTGAGLTNHDRGTGATGGGAELGFHLHLLTGMSNYDGDGTVAARPKSLGATNMMNWVSKYLQSSTVTGLYNNSLNDRGIDTNVWSYNQGVMLGANLLRYELTNSSTYLNNAVAIADKALSYYGNFEGQPPSFNAMLFQNMLALYQYAGSTLQSSMQSAMQSYCDWAWNNSSARDPNTNLFYFNDAGQPVLGTGQAAQLRDQGAMTQLYALLAWNSTEYSRLT
jgi:glycosyl hydrolase family 76